MRLVIIAAAFAGLALSAGAAFADDAAATPTSTTGDPDKIVCKQGDPTTGTRLGATRTCRTQREWDDLQQQAQKTLVESQLKSFGNRPAGSSN
ncbi:MAG TPA: hypothetical protein VGT78_03275 [Rhizomicrobium sp.]|nr:hypothetical protein [Rhizomicrobium sp.]